MTTEPPTTAAHHAADADDRSAAPSDLSDAFGRPAAASLRGLLPPRPRRSTEGAAPPERTSEQEDAAPGAGAATGPDATPGANPGLDDAGLDDSGPDDAGPGASAPPGRRRASAAPRAGRAAASTTPTAPVGTGTTNRRWGTVRMASQEHVELVVLVALSRGPADGRELAARLRADSAGGLAPPPTTVQRTLHHLVRHGLAERVSDTERRRLQLTELGTRVARARVRAWQALRRAVDAVVDGADEG